MLNLSSRLTILAVTAAFGVFFGAECAFADSADDSIAQMYSRVTGLVGRAADLRSLRAQCGEGAQGGWNEEKLFRLLSEDPAFINNRLATFVSVIGNEEAEPFEDVDDFQVSLILAIAHDVDLRDLLSKSYFIEAISEPGKAVAPGFNAYKIGAVVRTLADLPKFYRLNFSGEKTGPPADGYYNEGIMTTYGFGIRSIRDGTNRRAVRAAFDQFLCSKIDVWKDTALDDYYVGKDVDRKPGDNPETYQSICRGCHAPMDGMRGAFAYYDFDKNMNKLIVSMEVVKKYTQNASVFPEGTFVNTDATWENLLTDPAAQSRFGWRGGAQGMRGKGLLSFSTMVANSRQFQICITQRLVSVFCDKTSLNGVLQNPEFIRLTEDFRGDGYKTKTLIKKIAESKLCGR